MKRLLEMLSAKVTEKSCQFLSLDTWSIDDSELDSRRKTGYTFEDEAAVVISLRGRNLPVTGGGEKGGNTAHIFGRERRRSSTNVPSLHHYVSRIQHDLFLHHAQGLWN